MIRALIAIVLVGLSTGAAAQITTHYDPNGGIVERVYEGTTNGTKWAYTTSNGKWYSTPAGSGNVAGAITGRNLNIGSSQGAAVAGKLPVLLASEFTAANLAKAGIGVLRGGVYAVVVGAALDLALQKAHLAFDAAAQSVVYNPDPVHDPLTTTHRFWGLGNFDPDPDHPQYFSTQSAACNAVGRIMFGPQVFVSATAGTSPISCINQLLDTQSSPPVPYSLYREPLSIVMLPDVSPEQHCPNGVQFNNTTKCRQLVDDPMAGQLLTPYIDHGNGVQIGQNVTGNNGIQFSPDGSTGPSVGPGIDVDKNAWPQTSGPASQTYGPQTTTTSSQSTVPGTSATSTTTTTTTNTTNVTNTYNNNTTITNVDNKTEVKVCDATGVCTNTTTHTGTQGGENSPPADDKDVKVCGLPNTPPCKIDEKGTPSVADGLAGLKPATDALDAAKDDQIALVNGAPVTSDKDTSWHFSFAFPSACSPIYPWEGIVIDFCRLQPWVHDLMTVIWYTATVFGMLSMVGRTLRGGD